MNETHYDNARAWLLELLARQDQGHRLIAYDNMGANQIGFSDLDDDEAWFGVSVVTVKHEKDDLPEPYRTQIGDAHGRQALTHTPRTSFYLFEAGAEGCDYSIRCGERLSLLKGAESYPEALALALSDRHLGDEEEETGRGPISADPDPEFDLKAARIYEVAKVHPIDLAKYVSEAQIRRQAAEVAEDEAAERAQLAILKDKYEGR